MRFFSKIRLNNEAEKTFLLNEGLAEEKLKVVPLSIPLENYKILNNNEERKDLVYFGNITAKKNLPTIVKACSLVAKKYPGIKLHLIGREYEKIEENLIGQKLQIVRHGFIEKTSDVNVLLNKFLISLNSSFDEGMCVAVYNTALAGCALCLPKIMSFTQVFKDKALFHEVNDSKQLAKNIIFYLENQSMAQEHNKQCREMIMRDYNYQKISEQMKDLFTF
jgi:glycosyltransferase involved in cell wall biosynthesis